MITVSTYDLNTLTSHDSAPIRGRPTLKDAEQFRTGSIIHESAKNTFGYVKTCYKCHRKTCYKCYTKSCQKCYAKRCQKCDKSTTKMTNNTETNVQKTNINSQSSCCTVNDYNEHIVNMPASRKGTKNIDNAISSEQIPVKNSSIHLGEDDMENKNVFKAMGIKKLRVRSRYALFHVCTQKHMTDFTITGCHLRHRDREPSRIDVKWLTRKFGKSRLLRKRLRHNIRRSVPKSSHLHHIIENITHCQDTRMKCVPDVYCPKKVEKKSRTKFSAKYLNFIYVKVFLQIYFTYQVSLIIYMHKKCTKM